MQAMRFGNDLEACLKAIQIGFELSPRPNDTVYQGAVKTLEMVCTSLFTPFPRVQEKDHITSTSADVSHCSSIREFLPRLGIKAYEARA